MVQKISLQLFVIGPGIFSQGAIHHVQEIIREHPERDFQLDVIDVAEHPEIAEASKIIATPTLLRLHPSPACRVVGDMSDKLRLRELLGLHRRTVPADAVIESLEP